MTDEINLAGVRRQRGLYETCLIAQRLRCFSRPRWCLAVSEQVHGTDATLILQIVHQPAPLTCARYAGMYQHDRRAGGACFEIIDFERLIVIQSVGSLPAH